MSRSLYLVSFFFFNDTATTEIYTLSLPDALPIFLSIETSCDETGVAVVEGGRTIRSNVVASQVALHAATGGIVPEGDRKSTPLNSSHPVISYAAFCFKKKKTNPVS